MSIFKKYNVILKFREFVGGGLPTNPDILRSKTLFELRKKYIKDKENKFNIEDIKLFSKDIVPTTEKEMKFKMISESKERAVEDKINNTFLIFERFDGKPILRELHIKAMLKEALFTIKPQKERVKGNGTKTISKHALHAGIFVKPEIIPLNGKVLIHEKFMTFNRMNGNIPIHISELKKFEVIKKPTISFEIWNCSPDINEEVLLNLLEASTENGLGNHRRFGYGKFDIVKFEKGE